MTGKPMLKLYDVDPALDALGGSRESAKVAIALAETGADYEIEYLDRARDMRPADGYFKTHINPMGTVPTLLDGDFVLLESGAILRYLADKYPGAQLLPDDEQGKARAQQWLMWEGTFYCMGLINLCMYQPARQRDPGAFAAVSPVQPDDSPRTQAERSAALAHVASRNQLLDSALAKSEYIANNRYSIADIALGVHVGMSAGLIDIDLRPYPNIVAWLHRLEARPAWAGNTVFASDMQVNREKGLI